MAGFVEDVWSPTFRAGMRGHYRSRTRDHGPGERAVTRVGRKSHQCPVLGFKACDVGGHVSSASGFFWLGSGVWAAETCLVIVCIFLDGCGSLALLTFISSKTSFANSFLVLFFPGTVNRIISKAM